MYVGIGTFMSLSYSLAKSTTVSGVKQKRSGELTYPIGRTRLMKRSVRGSIGSRGITWEKIHISTGQMLHLWKASAMSHFER